MLAERDQETSLHRLLHRIAPEELTYWQAFYELRAEQVETKGKLRPPEETEAHWNVQARHAMD